MADRECWLLGGKTKVKLPLYYYGQKKQKQIPALFQPRKNTNVSLPNDKTA